MTINKALNYFDHIFPDIYLRTRNLATEAALEKINKIDSKKLTFEEKLTQNVLRLKIDKEEELNKARNNYRAALVYFKIDKINEFELMSYEWVIFELMDELAEINRQYGGI